jgi:hypothetical protein
VLYATLVAHNVNGNTAPCAFLKLQNLQIHKKFRLIINLFRVGFRGISGESREKGEMRGKKGNAGK